MHLNRSKHPAARTEQFECSDRPLVLEAAAQRMGTGICILYI